jgi:hypothetical protein
MNLIISPLSTVDQVPLLNVYEMFNETDRQSDKLRPDGSAKRLHHAQTAAVYLLEKERVFGTAFIR